MSSETLKYILPAIIGVLGVLIGALITFWANYLIKSRETAFRIHEKIFDKKIKAYENLLVLCQTMRFTHTTKFATDVNDNKTYPFCFESLESLKSFAIEYNTIANKNSFWVDIEIVRLLHFFKIYLSDLRYELKDLPEEQFKNVGDILKNDFLKFAYDLESKVVKFFELELESPKLKTRRGYFKYNEDTFNSLMENTALNKNKAVITSLK